MGRLPILILGGLGPSRAAAPNEGSLSSFRNFRVFMAERFWGAFGTLRIDFRGVLFFECVYRRVALHVASHIVNCHPFCSGRLVLLQAQQGFRFPLRGLRA